VSNSMSVKPEGRRRENERFMTCAMGCWWWRTPDGFRV
jgi:hypothetical protein